jgi:hemolysin III
MRAADKLYPIPAPLPLQTPGVETANSILLGLGVLLAAGGLVLLTLRAGGGLAIASYVIFTAAMTAMFLASTLYHAIQAEGPKRVFRVIDHSVIYLLIAGTYTPFSLLGFRGALGWVYFGLEWALAAAGISLYAANVKFIKKMELAVYILMGWAVLAGIVPLFRAIPRLSAVFLTAGGAAYTLGTIWYSRPARRGAHVVWHVFVLAGAILHWWAVWFLS